MNTHLTAGYITREVAGNMPNSVLAEFVNCPSLNVWLTESGLVQHSQDTNWPHNESGIPLIGARVIRMEISPQSYASLMSFTQEKPGAEKPDAEMIKRLLVRDIFSQVFNYVKLHERKLPHNLHKLALANAGQAKAMLDFVGYSQKSTVMEDTIGRAH